MRTQLSDTLIHDQKDVGHNILCNVLILAEEVGRSHGPGLVDLNQYLQSTDVPAFQGRDRDCFQLPLLQAFSLYDPINPTRYVDSYMY